MSLRYSDDGSSGAHICDLNCDEGKSSDISMSRVNKVRQVTVPPLLLPIVVPLAAPAAFLSNHMASLSHYALVYAGITGEAFFPSARRARALTSSRGLRSRAGCEFCV